MTTIETSTAIVAAATPAGRVSDTERARSFADRIVTVLNDGSAALLVSIGHRTGLLDTLAALPPATAAEIADRAGLNERYVQEWLGGMTVGGIVTYDPPTGTFTLPEEHAASLTRAAAPGNLAALAQYIGLLGSVEDRIVDCFRTGGGVPYSAFPRFQEVMAEDSGQTVLPALIGDILPLADGLTERLESGIEALDIGCGSGRAVHLLARRFPNSWFTGYDISPDGIARARREAEGDLLFNAFFAERDVAALGEAGRYDLVTAFDAIHDQVDPQGVLDGVFAALKPGGTLLMQDIDASSRLEANVGRTLAPFLYTISTMHCMTVSLAAGGAGLGTVWGVERALAMLAAAGFTDVAVSCLPHDPQNAYFVARKP